MAATKTRKAQPTKAQLQDMLTKLVKEARDSGQYDEFCSTGQEMIQDAEKLLGIAVEHENDVELTVKIYGGFVVGGDGDAEDADNYTVIVKNKDGKVLDAYIESATSQDW